MFSCTRSWSGNINATQSFKFELVIDILVHHWFAYARLERRPADRSSEAGRWAAQDHRGGDGRGGGDGTRGRLGKLTLLDEGGGVWGELPQSREASLKSRQTSCTSQNCT